MPQEPRTRAELRKVLPCLQSEAVEEVMDLREIERIVADAITTAMMQRIGGIPTREELEKGISNALGFLCQLPDYDEKTGKATKVVVCPPMPINLITITIDVGLEEK